MAVPVEEGMCVKMMDLFHQSNAAERYASVYLVTLEQGSTIGLFHVTNSMILNVTQVKFYCMFIYS